MEFISEDIVSLRPIYKQFIFLERFDEVWINGKNTHHFIEEHCLNACVKIGSLYILFTSGNIPWSDHSPWCENSSWRDVVTYYGFFKATIYLFNDKGEMLDQTSIKSTNFSEYTSSNSNDDEGPLGSHLINFKLTPPDIVTFSFGVNWTLKLLKEPVLFTEELYRKGLGLLDKPRRHGIIKRLFCFLTKLPLGSQPKNLRKTYFDLSVKIIK